MVCLVYLGWMLLVFWVRVGCEFDLVRVVCWFGVHWCVCGGFRCCELLWVLVLSLWCRLMSLFWVCLFYIDCLDFAESQGFDC